MNAMFQCKPDGEVRYRHILPRLCRLSYREALVKKITVFSLQGLYEALVRVGENLE